MIEKLWNALAFKHEGFTPAEPVTIWHRLALVDLKIRWDDDGAEDAILGILPVLGHSFNELFTSAAYDFMLCFKMIGDDHPRLRKLCYPMSHRLSKIGIGE